MKRQLLKRLPVRYVLLLSFIVLISGLIYVQVAQYNQYNHLANQYNAITGNSVDKLSLLINLRRGSDYVQTQVLHLLLSKDPNEIAVTRKKIQEEIDRNDTNMREFEKLVIAKEEKKLFDSLTYYRKQNSAVRAFLMNLAVEGHFNKSQKFYLDSQHITYEHLQKANTLLATFVKDSASHQKNRLNTTIASDNKKTLEINLFIVALLILMGIAVLRTIQKMKEDHLQLAESEAKYRYLIEHTNEIINRCDASGKIIFANKAFKEKLGYDDEELAQLSIPDILDENSMNTFNPSPSPEKDGTLLKNVQKIYIAKSGKKIRVEGSIIIEYRNRKCIAAEAYFNDITEKYNLQQQLVASEKKYRSIFEFSPLPKIIYDINTYEILQVNTAAIQHYGYNNKEWLSLKITDIIAANYLPEAKAALIQLQQNSEAFESKMKHITKNGALIDVEIRGVPFEYEGHKARLITILDVTERNETENRISKAIMETQEQEHFQISAELHDNVNQILTGAVFTLGLLKKESLPAQQLDAIVTAHKYISMAIETIRKISHRLAPPSFNLVEFSDSIQMLLNGVNKDRKYLIEYVYNVPKEVKLPDDVMLNLYRILQEQLNNIYKYANATIIEVNLNADDKEVELYIYDNGRGFDMKIQRNGIGLSNIQRRAALFSGYARILSSPGNGCSVKVFIPLS
ncbi:PAS domain S-box protein [Hydrotalea sp.]|uniref:PAS domain S-box protein n=1 Tax=Hydrotalea sp. TaxID=2881279 RepID=UPI003D0C6976